jgi:hypothetical protein
MTSAELTATLSYLVPGVARPIYIASQGGADAAMDIGAEFEQRHFTMLDGRRATPAPSLDREGFCLVDHAAPVTDFYQLEPEREAYEDSIRALVLDVTGGDRALVFDHTLRSDSRIVRGERTTREPAAVIHNDYTDASAEKRLRDLVPEAETARRLQRRYAIVNVWRSIAGPAINSPLALCDAATLDAADLVASERRAAERIGELELGTYNPEHRWFYFPGVTRDEALLIKTFDSATDGRARRAVHTAFDNPTAEPEAPPRESIESRLLVFF